MEPWRRRRPDLYADIPVPVLQVPAAEEGGPGGLPNLLEKGEKKEDGRGEEGEQFCSGKVSDIFHVCLLLEHNFFLKTEIFFVKS